MSHCKILWGGQGRDLAIWLLLLFPLAPQPLSKVNPLRGGGCACYLNNARFNPTTHQPQNPSTSKPSPRLRIRRSAAYTLPSRHSCFVLPFILPLCVAVVVLRLVVIMNRILGDELTFE
jgi:hypothetical protein